MLSLWVESQLREYSKYAVTHDLDLLRLIRWEEVGIQAKVKTEIAKYVRTPPVSKLYDFCESKHYRSYQPPSPRRGANKDCTILVDKNDLIHHIVTLLADVLFFSATNWEERFCSHSSTNPNKAQAFGTTEEDWDEKFKPEVNNYRLFQQETHKTSATQIWVIQCRLNYLVFYLLRSNPENQSNQLPYTALHPGDSLRFIM